jgi:hypothetical protein
MFRWISRLWCRHDDRQTFQQDGLWAGARVKVQCRKCGRITTHLMVNDPMGEIHDCAPMALHAADGAKYGFHVENSGHQYHEVILSPACNGMTSHLLQVKPERRQP